MSPLRKNALPNHLFHFIGRAPLLVSLIAQVIVLATALKSGEKPQAFQAVAMMLALALITGGIFLRPAAAPNLAADAVSCVGSVLLLAPGVAALVKMQKKQAAG